MSAPETRRSRQKTLYSCLEHNKCRLTLTTFIPSALDEVGKEGFPQQELVPRQEK